MNNSNETHMTPEIIDGINVLIKNDQWDFLNLMMMNFRIEEADVVIVLAWARSTFAVRQKLPHYAYFIQRCYNRVRLLKGSVEAARIMTGLV